MLVVMLLGLGIFVKSFLFRGWIVKVPAAWGIFAAEFTTALGFIVMGIGMILENQDLINNGALIALAGVVGMVLALKLSSLAFASIAGVLVALVAAIQSVISSIFPWGG